MAKTDLWDKNRGVIRSSRGGWTPGVGIKNCGYSMMEDLVGKVDYLQVLMLNVLGRLPERRLSAWLGAIFTCVSWPDSRIWCNQVGAFAGAARTRPLAGICAGLLASDSRMYGPGTKLPIAEFIRDAVTHLRIDPKIAEFLERRPKVAGRPIAPGFARPLAHGDERVEAMQRVADDLGYEVGEHLKAAYVIEDYLVEHYGESINLAGYAVAFLLDQDFSPNEIFRLSSISVNAGVHATYIEAVESPAESYLPLRCDDVKYIGVEERPVPGVVQSCREGRT